MKGSSMTKEIKPQKHVCITLTDEESKALREIAKREGVSASEWIGLQIRKMVPKPLPDRMPSGRPRK
jgi:hypothetical protein